MVLASGLIDYWASIWIAKSNSSIHRRQLLWLSIFSNLGILSFFKYYNFFISSFTSSFSFLGIPFEAHTLEIILPVGISFYTFQSMSYTIDVYRKDIEPSRNPIEFGAYLLFFPQLVAGPIERATSLIPQFRSKRIFSPTMASDGLRQMLWGLFKKVAVADQCAPFVDSVFHDHWSANTSTLILGAILFAIQIYCDFSGYSDIAVGCARLFGFTLMRNFALPFFSRDIAEFWRRWHISLNTWFRDYLYIPLGGSRGNLFNKIKNIFIIFIVSGLWHGANWTFIVWGLLNAIYFLPLMLTNRNRQFIGTVAPGRLFPGWINVTRMAYTFSLAVFAFIFFRSDTVREAIYYIRGIFTRPGISIPNEFTVTLALSISVMFIVEWLQREKQHALELSMMPRIIRWIIYLPIAFVITMMAGEKVSFIYFQF